MSAIPEGWNVGDIRPCGCEVVYVSQPCEFHEQEWGYAQSDCGECEFGIPGVWHSRNDDCTGEDA
jgi:hypothetical protein